MRGRTQGKKVCARSQRVRDYHQEQTPGARATACAAGLGEGRLAAGPQPPWRWERHVLLSQVSHLLDFPAPDLKSI